VALEADAAALTRFFENLLSNCAEHGAARSRSAAGSGAETERETETDTDTDTGDAGPERSSAAQSRRSDSDRARATVRVVALEDGVAVEDDGPRIPEGERERVFDPNYTTADDGAGVGLVSVRQVAGAHGWDVCVTESAAGGARFEFRDAERVEGAPRADLERQA
jgi:signal transduction histidine kinase